MEQFHSCFNYKITDSSISGYLAQVSAQLTTFDSDSILSQYEKELNTYLGSADAVIDGSQKRYDKSHELLLDSIKNNESTITANAVFHLINDGASWKLEDAGTELGNAIFGTLTASPVPEDMTEDISDDQAPETKRSLMKTIIPVTMKRKQKKSMIMSMIPTVTNKINPADVRNYTGDFVDPVKNSHLNFLVIQTETENK